MQDGQDIRDIIYIHAYLFVISILQYKFDILRHNVGADPEGEGGAPLKLEKIRFFGLKS